MGNLGEVDRGAFDFLISGFGPGEEKAGLRLRRRMTKKLSGDGRCRSRQGLADDGSTQVKDVAERFRVAAADD